VKQADLDAAEVNERLLQPLTRTADEFNAVRATGKAERSEESTL